MCKKLQQTFLHRRQRSDQYIQEKWSTSLSISEMETKSKGNITFKDVYCLKKKKKRGRKNTQILARIWRSGTSVPGSQKWHSHYGIKMAQPLWNNLEVPQNIIKRIIRSRNHSFQFMSKVLQCGHCKYKLSLIKLCHLKKHT